MKKRHQALKLRIALIVILCSVTGVTAPVLVPSVAANQKPNTQKIQKWEYCAITTSYPVSRYDSETHAAAVSIIYLNSSGYRKEEIRSEISEAEIKKEASDKNNIHYIRALANQRAADDALAKAIAKLGEEGWEMVGEGPFRFGNERNEIALYFKRPKL